MRPSQKLAGMSFKYHGYRAAQWLSARLPPAAAFRCAERLADVQWRWATNDRAAVRHNLSVVTGMPLASNASMSREVFRNFARYVVEFFSIHVAAPPRVTMEGYEGLVTAQRRGRGVIILTAHLGNWEVGAILLHRLGFPITAVALPHEDPRMNRLFERQRQRCGVKVIPLGRSAAQQSLERLRAGELLGLLGDREFTGHGVAVSWFGRQAVLPRGPAILSLRSRAPIVPTFLIREGRWTFRLCFEPPIEPTAYGQGERAIRQVTEAYATVLERRLRQHPEQWLVFQPLGTMSS